MLANHSRETDSARLIACLFALPFIPAALFGFIFKPALLFASPLVLIHWGYLRINRRQESEADYIGMMLMADADFDPSAAVTFFNNLKIMEDGFHNAAPERQQNPEWLSSHPHVSWPFY